MYLLRHVSILNINYYFSLNFDLKWMSSIFRFGVYLPPPPSPRVVQIWVQSTNTPLPACHDLFTDPWPDTNMPFLPWFGSKLRIIRHQGGKESVHWRIFPLLHHVKWRSTSHLSPTPSFLAPILSVNQALLF